MSTGQGVATSVTTLGLATPDVAAGGARPEVEATPALLTSVAAGPRDLKGDMRAVGGMAAEEGADQVHGAIITIRPTDDCDPRHTARVIPGPVPVGSRDAAPRASAGWLARPRSRIVEARAGGPLGACHVRIGCRASPRGRGGAGLRLARLAKAAEVQGFWPCLLAEGAQKARAPGRPHTVLNPLVLNGPSASSARLSITSGCPGYCSFCLEGWDRRPYAEADIDRLLAEARKLRRATGAVDLEIYSFNFNTHSRIFDLIFELNRVFRRVSFMSQRLDILAETRGLIEVELAGGKRSFTLGIEGISESMRAYYRKGLTAEHIEICLEKTIRPGIKELKLFFIIAGTETTADIAEFAALMESIKRRKDANSPSTRILVSAGFLVRLPFTPLQYAPLEFDRDKLARLGLLLGEACDRSGIEFRLASDVEESFIDQALSLAGGRGLPLAGKNPIARLQVRCFARGRRLEIDQALHIRPRFRPFLRRRKISGIPSTPRFHRGEPKLHPSSRALHRSEGPGGQVFLPWQRMFSLRRLWRQ